ncbi:glycosyltransferase family 4 protein [Clostridium sp. OS1-26]|uniref:glycosyltransferase family 4 protein n=1 Tax=Clostridium sp. OS1-26 TaxID=3070681 RepID=UPI0027DEF35E|nr:glycosyltransferase family 4 protein [Clostridium sp. OS1-26]WML35846.1 glycosyltransferase family 4 protein [Clostridium sp. OS1-26]
MKVLYVYPFCGLGGVETSIINKIEALKSLKIHAEAILLNVWSEGGKYILNNNIKGNLTIEEIINILNKDFDVITIIDYPQFINLINKLNIKSKIIYETHCSELDQIKKSCNVVNHKKISAIIVPSIFNRETILKLTKTNKKIFVLYNPINMKQFTNIPNTQLDKSYQKFLNKRNVIWIGRLEKNKNPIEFIKMGNILLRNNKDLHFIMIGDKCGNHSYFRFIKSNIPKNYISNYTFFHSIPNKKMPELFSLAANTGGCLVSSSENESLPMIFLEAMACKCPIISTDVGGVRELIVNNKSGKIYKLNNINEGCKAINELIDKENTAVRKEIVNNAYSMVKSRHSIERVAEKYRIILNHIFQKQ